MEGIKTLRRENYIRDRKLERRNPVKVSGGPIELDSSTHQTRFSIWREFGKSDRKGEE